MKAQKKSPAVKRCLFNNQVLPFGEGLVIIDINSVTLGMSRAKHLFELSTEEQNERLQNRIVEIQQSNLKAGLYNLFLDPHSKERRIRQYQDHAEVITVNETTGHSRVVKCVS